MRGASTHLSAVNLLLDMEWTIPLSRYFSRVTGFDFSPPARLTQAGEPYLEAPSTLDQYRWKVSLFKPQFHHTQLYSTNFPNSASSDTRSRTCATMPPIGSRICSSVSRSRSVTDSSSSVSKSTVTQ